jgi:hypothetical protein
MTDNKDRLGERRERLLRLVMRKKMSVRGFYKAYENALSLDIQRQSKINEDWSVVDDTEK